MSKKPWPLAMSLVINYLTVTTSALEVVESVIEGVFMYAASQGVDAHKPVGMNVTFHALLLVPPA